MFVIRIIKIKEIMIYYLIILIINLKKKFVIECFNYVLNWFNEKYVLGVFYC